MTAEENDSGYPKQVKIIESTMSKRDCMVVMPTSDGKSACFLIPVYERQNY
ncbi:hypothetical protein DAPPUDRAFT_251211 [Daphnia pulex]|uniref:DEAD/DEAH-box helicase domain-containing protein n=1 Tax=Daphnia pulex TaxID=6669 RepID=E9GZX9_DAPPU|nr:hypothetical protein DAPPUDRAFT_251211 [Daphnia pulex]|eukprot:EFX74896.1 hypothetical protein DAPPUDRAFT_251211 [Daphnia pulex]